MQGGVGQTEFEVGFARARSPAHEDVQQPFSVQLDWTAPPYAQGKHIPFQSAWKGGGFGQCRGSREQHGVARPIVVGGCHALAARQGADLVQHILSQVQADRLAQFEFVQYGEQDHVLFMFRYNKLAEDGIAFAVLERRNNACRHVTSFGKITVCQHNSLLISSIQQFRLNISQPSANLLILSGQYLELDIGDLRRQGRV